MTEAFVPVLAKGTAALARARAEVVVTEGDAVAALVGACDRANALAETVVIEALVPPAAGRNAATTPRFVCVAPQVPPGVIAPPAALSW